MRSIVRDVLVCTSMLLCAAAPKAEGSQPQPGPAGQVLVLFMDTNVLRRTWDSGPAIGSGQEDFSVRISCMDRDDCIYRIKAIYKLLSTKEKIVDSCKKPIYVELRISPDPEFHEGSDENKPDVYDVDYTGTCVSHGHESYKIKSSIYGILNGRPIPAWGMDQK